MTTQIKTNTTEIATDYFDGGVWCADSPLTVTYPCTVILAQDLPHALDMVSVGASQHTDASGTTWALTWTLRDAVTISRVDA